MKPEPRLVVLYVSLDEIILEWRKIILSKISCCCYYCHYHCLICAPGAPAGLSSSSRRRRQAGR